MAETVADMRDAYVMRCGVPRDAVTALVDPASPVEFGEALAGVAESAHGLLIVHYIGHGLLGNDGRLHLATQMTSDNKSHLPYSALAYASMRDTLREAMRAGVQTLVVILDCCFAGRALGDMGQHANPLSGVSDISGAFVLTAVGRTALATAPLESRHTAFTGALIHLLTVGDSEGPADFSLSALFQSLRRKQEADSRPLPHSSALDNAGDLLLAPNPAFNGRTPPARTAPAVYPAVRTDLCPYKGLQPFGESDTSLFFGRERLTDALTRRLSGRYGQPRPLIVTAPSGSGKSSLLRAGLASAVSRGELGILGSARWPRAYITPGDAPLARLAEHLCALGHLPLDPTLDALREDPNRASTLFRRLAPRGGRLVLTVDQFEEAFASDREERDRYVDTLMSLSTGGDHGPVALVVLAVRADFYAQCIEIPALLPAFDDGPVIITAMTTDEVRAVIEGPAAAAGLILESGLVPLIMSDFGVREPAAGSTPAGAYEAGRLPLLSYALYATWATHRGQSLTISGYRQTRGIHGALNATAENAYQTLDEQSRAVARGVFLRLVNLGNGGRPTRRTVPLGTLLDEMPDTAGTRRVLDVFAAEGARLVTIDRDTIEIAHEALLTAWDQLSGWIDDSRDAMIKERAIVEAAGRWAEESRDEGLLLRGTRLESAREWLDAEHDVEPSPVATGFVRASLGRQRVEHRRAASRRWGVIGVLLMLIVVVGVIAIRENSAATREKAVARAQKLLLQAIPLSATKPSASLLLQAASMLVHPTGTARAAMVSTLMGNHFAATMKGHAAAVQAVAFQPGGKKMITVSADRTAVLTDVADPQRPRWIATLTGHGAAIRAAVFSPDGRLAATGGDDHVTLVWDVSSPRTPPVALRARSGVHVRALAFRPGGGIVFAGGSDGYAQLWDVRDLSAPHATTLPDVTGTIRGAAFGPEGHVLVTAGDDGTITIWDTRRPTHPVRLATVRQNDELHGIALSPDGHALAAAGQGGSIGFWNITDPRRPARLSPIPGTSPVHSLVFMPDGRRLIAAAENGITTIWDLIDPAPPSRSQTFARQTEKITSIALRDDGHVMATASTDGTAVLWYIEDPAHPPTSMRLISSPTSGQGQSDGQNRAIFNSKGDLLIRTSCCDKPQLIDLSDPRHPAIRPAFDEQVAAIGDLAYDDARRLVVTVDWSGFIIVWRLTGDGPATPLSRVNAHSGALQEVELSPDGRLVAASGGDGTTVWDLSEPTQPHRVTALENADVDDPTHYQWQGLAFSPDGHTLAASSKSVTLWDLTDPANPVARPRLTDARGPAVFAHGGAVLVTRTSEGVAVWDTRDTTHPARLASMASNDENSPTGLSVSAKNVLAIEIHDGVDLWDLSDTGDPRRLTTVAARTVTGFSQDGRWLVVEYPLGGTADASPAAGGLLLDIARITQVVIHPQDLACAVADRQLTQREWQSYLPDLDYRPVCGQVA
ncbi:AAA family ATPase [Streptosporangiaceae bacterium NEAU-GS5]|nr:AAA family ATPase [Streptosporangiaceae bacterium NEAU-GS5]